MTTAGYLSEVVADLLTNSNRVSGGELTLLRTLNTYSVLKRKEGCFFRQNDVAFDVPELRTFRDFALRLRAEADLTNGFAILDYGLPSIPKEYINAMYLLIDETHIEEIERCARRLTALYRVPAVATIVFDSNKIIGSRRHYESFVLSRDPAPREQCPDEYFVDLAGIEKELSKLIPAQIDRLFNIEDENYIEALREVYDGIRSGSPRDRIPQIIRDNCSALVSDTVLEKETRKVGDLEFEDVYSAFLTYIAFFLSITPKANEFVYLPVQMVAGPEQSLRWVGGILLPFVRPSLREDRVPLRNAAQVIVSSFYSAYTDALLLQSLEKAAQAQIMSRNMSHNLGSHALARIKASDIKKAPADAERLLGYLQERMDFVARVATEWPAWREPVLFLADLVRGFFKQGLLLNNLIADDGYAAENVEFYVRLPGQPNPILFTCPKESAKQEQDAFSEFREYGARQEGVERPDVIVAIPGGPVGRQSFYGFLENALRNAAKHNRGDLPLRVFLELEDGSGTEQREAQFYRLKYQDSISVVDTKPELINTIQAHLSEGLVNPRTRQPVVHAWGIQEMKVYARYLAHPFESQSTVSGQNHQLRAEAKPFLLSSDKQTQNLDQVASSTTNVLTYTLGLQRPCLAMIAGAHRVPGNDDVRRRYGLEISTSTVELSAELLRAKAPGLLYVVDEADESTNDTLVDWLNERRLWLPARTLIWSKSLNVGDLKKKLRQLNLTHRVRIDPGNQPLTTDGETEEERVKQYVIQLYRRWLSAIAVERGFDTPFNIVMYFDREGSSCPHRWAKLGAAVEEFKLFDFDSGSDSDRRLINVFPIEKTFVQAPSTTQNDAVLTAPWEVVAHRWIKENKSERSLGNVKIEAGSLKGSWLIFDNHGNGRPTGIEPTFYQYIGSYSKDGSEFPNNREVFDRLSEVPDGFVGVLSLIQLVEACILKVLILDERVAGTALELESRGAKNKLRWKATTDSARFGQSIARHLQDSGVFFAPFFNVEKGDQSERLCSINADGEVTCDLRSDLICEIEIEDSLAVSCKASDPGSSLCDSSNLENPPFDVVVIHKGLIEWLGVRIKGFRQNEFLSSLHNLGARVIVTSGRGAQMEGEISKYPFMEFAVLEDYIVRELSKPSLGNVLMAVTGQDNSTVD